MLPSPVFQEALNELSSPLLAAFDLKACAVKISNEAPPPCQAIPLGGSHIGSGAVLA